MEATPSEKRSLITLLSAGYSKDPKDLETRNNLCNLRLSCTSLLDVKAVLFAYSHQLLELHVDFRNKKDAEGGYVSEPKLPTNVELFRSRHFVTVVVFVFFIRRLVVLFLVGSIFQATQRAKELDRA
jgi:hypothetical protein